MKSIWTGGISFGLIYIPVNLYSATQEIQLDLDYLNKKDLSPIRYARIDKKTGKEVPWKDVVKGYQYKKGDYVVLSDEDFEHANLRKSKSIDISCFVNLGDINPKLFEKPYYLEPASGADKTYALLAEALEKSGRVGVAEFVLRNREHLCVLIAEDGVLVLHQLRYPAQVKAIDELKIPRKVSISGNELKMAVDLVNQLSEKFNPRDFKDDYIQELRKVISLKAAHKPIRSQEKLPSPTKTSNIALQLRKSLEQFSTRKHKSQKIS